MFTLARTERDIVSFEFGTPVDPPLSLEERVLWIMADYENRRDEFMRISISQSVAILIRLLLESVEDPSRLILVIRALGFLGSPNSAAQLAGLLSHPSRDVQRETIWSLGKIGSLEELPSVEAFLTSPDRELRRAAIVAASRSIDPAVLVRIEAAAGDDSELRGLARQGRRRLDALQAQNMRAYVDAIIETEEFEDLMRLMEGAAGEVLDVLIDRTRDPVVRARAARVIGLVRMRQSSRQLAKVLADPNEPRVVRLQVIIAAGRCRAYPALQSLIDLLNDPDLEFEERAITALGEIGAEEALGPLMSKWDDRNWSLRPIILLALDRLAHLSGTDLLRRLLREDRPWSPEVICFVDEQFRLSTRYSAGLLDAALYSLNTNARRDAILLMAFLASNEELPKLQQIFETDVDAENRGLARLAVSRLSRG